MKKNFLFSMLAVLLAGFWFGGASLAHTLTINTNPTTNQVEYDQIYRDNGYTISDLNSGDIVALFARAVAGYTFDKATTTAGDAIVTNNGNIGRHITMGDGDATVTFDFVLNCSNELSVACIGDRGYATLAAAVSAANDGDIVTLLSNITLDTDIMINNGINLDLSGTTITSNTTARLKFLGGSSRILGNGAIENTATFPIMNIDGGSLIIDNGTFSSQDGRIMQVMNGGEITINTGSFTASGVAIWIKGGSGTINGGTISSTNNYAFYAFNNSTLTIESVVSNAKYVTLYSDSNSTVTVKGGTYSSLDSFSVIGSNGSTLVINNGTFSAPQSSAIGINTDTTLTIENATVSAKESSIVVETGSNLTIENGTFTSADNCLVFMNGSAGRGGNVININGGTFNGNITSDGAIACGVAASNNDTVNINGGTFNIKDGAGIIARGGTTTLGSGVTFNFTYQNKSFGTLGKVGDSRVVVPVGYELVMDVASDYPGASETFVTINNLTGTYIATNDKDTPDPYVVSAKDGNKTVPFTLTKDGTTAKISEAPQITEGYQWYNGDETTPYVFNSAITNNVTLTSRINTYTIKFDVNAEWVENPADEVITHGSTATEPDEPVYTGYIFQGWFKDDEEYNFSTAVTASFTLTGRWEALSDSTGAVEGEDFTGVVLVPAEPALTASQETDIETAIASSSNSTATMEGVVEVVVYADNDENGVVGSGDVELTGNVNFTTARLVRIPVTTTGNVVVKVRHTGQSGFSYNGLTINSGASCSNGVASVANDRYNGEPITPTSGYVEIYTCSASTFVAYTETATPTSSTSGGGGGGSSSSYSCKNLPANAAANNTTKPKKNTDYSYSTNTGAVCTFQCKSGYTRNADTSKCVKAETGTTVDDTEDADSDTSDTDTTSTEDLQKVLDDGYTVEFHKAYEFAFKNGITTMPSIQAADMNSPLTRIAMAKMLSQYAINVLGKKPANIVVPNFPDVSAELDEQYNNGVTLAYQLGIMGINIDKFRPDDLVTRAEFGTALSRMLFGWGDGEPYYATHLQKLMSEGIITNDNPRLDELRGYVMIMLMRSANK